MKTEYKLFGILAVFFLVVTPIYAYFTDMQEWVGIVALLLTFLMVTWLFFYLRMTGRKLELRPDDDPEGEIDEQAGDYGFFSPHSWWPLWLALGAAAIFLGVAIGWWLAIIAAPFTAVALVGWVFEYFRGEHAV